VTVSVGFVDLGSLIWSEIREDVTALPSQWIGYEASPLCVAKTLVIAEMFKNGSSVESIVQVWFSSIWKITTMTLFLRALKTVIENFYHEPQDHIEGNKLSSKVLTFLKYWSMH
jgi:hypothetical protein